MKTRLVHYRFLLCAVVICGLLASPLLDITQAQTTRQVGLREAPVVAQEDTERLPIKCPKPPVVYSTGTVDNFVVKENATLSPALQSFFVGKPRREFDDGGIDRGFGQSFQLNCCKICAATLEVRIRNEQPGGLANNDGLTVGIAPFNVKFASVGPLWTSSPTPLVKTVTVPLPPGALNNYIMNSASCPWWLDVYVQDDTAVDYVKLTVWYY